MRENQVNEDTIKLLCERYGRQFGEHFIHFVFKGHDFDFNAFKTQKEWDDYKKDLEYFEERTKGTK